MSLVSAGKKNNTRNGSGEVRDESPERAFEQRLHEDRKPALELTGG